MKGQILLINPWIYDFAAYDFWSAPLGLLSLAAVLRKDGYETKVIDCLRSSIAPPALPQKNKPKRFSSGHGKFYKDPLKKPLPLQHVPKQYSRYGIKEAEFRFLLKQNLKPELILLTSMMTYWYPAVFDAVSILREEFPHTPIILGGNYVTLCPEHAKQAGADLLVYGEGESQIPELIRYLLGKNSDFKVDFDDLDSYPYPAHDLQPQIDQIPILTSRGCPLRCSYCASHLLVRRYRRRSPLHVADEIEHWHTSYGVRHFSFYDDALLIAPHEMIIPLLNEIIRRNLNCRFHCPNGLHARMVSPETAKLMFKAGFSTLRFGFETADTQRQRDTGGKIFTEEMERAVFYLKEAGYSSENIGIYLLCGLPGQTADEVSDAVGCVKSWGARPYLAEYSPIPGTPLWDIAVEASPYPIAAEPLFHNNSLLACRSDSLDDKTYRKLKLQTR